MPAKGSGIKTARDLRKRCSVQPDGCWLWNGALGTNGEPRLQFVENGKARIISVARAAVLLSGKTPQARSWMSCGCTTCANPSHAVTGTAAQWGEWYRENDIWKGSIRRKLAVTAARREQIKRALDLDIDKAVAIRYSGRTNKEEALINGVRKDVISRIRCGRTWLEANPFTGLGARA